jgi:hypothetical protein
MQAKPYDIIYVGSVKAVVCRALKDSSVDVIYFDGRQHICEGAKSEDGKWAFKHPGPDGSYADKISEYAPFIAALKASNL